jgi:RHS repeat-associated protein
MIFIHSRSLNHRSTFVGVISRHLPLLIKGVLVALAIFPITNAARAEKPKERVLNIEAAMRTWQERYNMTTGFKAGWYNRTSDDRYPGDYPEDCFYAVDLLDPVKATALVENLYFEMRFRVERFIKTPADGSITSPSGFTVYSLDNVPQPTTSNYVAVFEQLVDILQHLNVTGFGSQANAVLSTSKSSTNLSLWPQESNCDQAKTQIYNAYVASQSLSGSAAPAISETLGIALTTPPSYHGSLSTVKASFRYDLSRYTGTAKHGTRVQLRLDNVVVDTGSYALAEVPQTGGVWTSQLYGWAASDITGMTVDCPASNQTKSRQQSHFPLIVVRPVYTYHINEVWTECHVCLDCLIECVAGSWIIANRSIDVSLPLGKDARGLTGMLHLKADLPSAELGSPRSLRTQLQGSMKVLTDITQLNGNNLPLVRQIEIPQGLVDVVVLSNYAYELRYYAPAQLGAKDAQGFFSVTGTPFTVVKIENPDASPSTFNRLRVTGTRGGVTEVATYTYDSATSGWALQRVVDGNTVTDTRSSTFDAPTNRRTETHVIQDEGGRTVLNERNTYEVFPWNTGANARLPEELIESISDPSGAALKTTYEFYSNLSTDGPNYGKVKSQVEPSGFWRKFEYDAQSRVIKVTTAFQNAAPGATEGVRTVETLFSSSSPNETNIESLVLAGGTVVELRRSYRNFSDPDVTSIAAAAAGAAWNAAGNLVSVSRVYDDGEFIGRPAWEIRPDGTGTRYEYASSANGNLTTTTHVGALNATQDAVIAGTRTISIASKSGELVDESVYDIASGFLISSRTTTQTDGFGRPTRIDYLGGTFEQRSYGCCGLDFIIDREGVRTDYTYDVFKRLKSETRAGVTQEYTYDGSGRRLTVTRKGSNGSSMLRETNVYDVAGRLQSTNAAGRLTTFAEVTQADGRTVKTTTGPDGATRVETYARDGSLLTIGGTAASPLKYEYGTDAAGFFQKEIKVGTAGQETEWAKSYTDFLGRSSKLVFPDSATSQSFYNEKSQLVRTVDPDGVTALYAYNTQGEPETMALDLNGNGLIDFAGLDRITRTTNAVAAKVVGGTTYYVRRATMEAWETDNQNAPTTVSISEQATDGLRSWETVRGLTSTAVTALDGSGGRTVTVTGPDGVKTIQVFSNGRLVSNTVKTAADVQVMTVSNGYDAHGRLQTSTDARNGATTYTYHFDDQVQSVTTPDPDTAKSGPGYDPQVTTFAYDNAGRASAVTHPDNGIVNTTYWPTGAVKRTSGTRTYPVEYTYDSQGRVKTLTTWQNFVGDSGKAVTTWNYHAQRGWLENKRYPDNTGPGYTYKPSGRLLTRTWARTPLITTTYGYNTAGDLQATDYSDSTPDVAITYDRAGRSKTITDGSGSRNLSYHASGQLEDEIYTSGLLNGFVVDRSFDSIHRLSGVSVPSVSSVVYAYDAASRLATVTTVQNTATYGYVVNSPLAESVTFKNNGTTRLTTTKTYDKLNRLSAIGNQPSAAGLSVITYNYTYNAANQRTRVTREDNAYWDWVYDWLGQVTAAKKYLVGAVPALGQDYAWSFDDIGNRKTATKNGAAATYTSNLLNQYAQRTVPGVIDVSGAADSMATVTVAVNNGTQQATTRQGEAFYKQVTVNNASAAQNASLKITGVKNLVGPNQEDAVTEITKNAFVAQAPETFAHDLDGNLTIDARWNYTWDGENRLITLETSTAAVNVGVPRQKLEFSYDGQGRRVSKKVSNWNSSVWTLASHTLFIYEGWNMMAELNGMSSNASVRTYTWGIDLSGSPQGVGGVGGLLSVTDVLGSTTHFAAFDGNGNVGGLVKAIDGTFTAKYDYNAFGEPVLIEGAFAIVNPFRFSSKFTDTETGHLYYGYRCYVPEMGRWLNRDPITEKGGPNLYGMVGNDSINSYDYLGFLKVTDFIRAQQALGKSINLCKCCPEVANLLNKRLSDIIGEIDSDGIDQIISFTNQLQQKASDYTKKSKNITKPTDDALAIVDFLNGAFGVKFHEPTRSTLAGLSKNLSEVSKSIKTLGKIGKITAQSAAISKGDAISALLTIGEELSPPGISNFMEFYGDAFRASKAAISAISKLSPSSIAIYEEAGSNCMIGCDIAKGILQSGYTGL